VYYPNKIVADIGGEFLSPRDGSRSAFFVRFSRGQLLLITAAEFRPEFRVEAHKRLIYRSCFGSIGVFGFRSATPAIGPNTASDLRKQSQGAVVYALVKSTAEILFFVLSQFAVQTGEQLGVFG